jgi:predicted PurR-regulated permease PerM
LFHKDQDQQQGNAAKKGVCWESIEEINMMDTSIEPRERQDWPPRRVVQATILFAAIATAFYLIIRFQLVVLSLFSAIVISNAMEPVLVWLNKRGISRGVAAALIFLIMLILIVGVILLMAPLITNQGAQIVETFGNYYQTARDYLAQSSNLLLRRIGLQMPLTFPPEIQTSTSSEEGLEQQMQTVVAVGQGVIRTVLYAIAILLITFYWTLEGQTAVRSLVLFVRPEKRQQVRDFIDTVLEQLGKYTRGLLLLSAIVGALYLAAYLIIGVPNALLLAIIGAAFEIVPLIGPFLGILPAFLIVVALDPTRLIWLIAAFAVIQQLENSYLTPRVMKATADVNPIVTLLALTAFGSLFGLLGAVLAIPLAMVISLVINELVFKKQIEAPEAPAERDRVSLLLYSARELTQDLQRQIRHKETATSAIDDHFEDTIEAIADDLIEILEKVEEKRENMA